LAVPGTSLLIYGALVLVIFLLSIGIVTNLLSRHYFKDIWERLRRRRLLRRMAKFLRRLKQEASFGENENTGSYLCLLSTELREFLSLCTGLNCRSLSAVEFLDLPLEDISESLGNEAFKWSSYLCCLFRVWDTLRFSGQNITMKDLVQALNDTETFVSALDKTERENPLFKVSKGLTPVAEGL
jgi:hypothetical protein